MGLIPPRAGFALTCGVRSRSRRGVLGALIPIAAGHALSLACAGAAIVFGLSINRLALQMLAGGLLAVVAIAHLAVPRITMKRNPAAHAGLALCSFMMSTAHGAGLMLVPAFIGVCIGDAPTQEAGTANALMTALAAVGIHTATMLAVTGLLTSLACHVVKLAVRLPASRWIGGVRQKLSRGNGCTQI